MTWITYGRGFSVTYIAGVPDAIIVQVKIMIPEKLVTQRSVWPGGCSSTRNTNQITTASSVFDGETPLVVFFRFPQGFSKKKRARKINFIPFDRRGWGLQGDTAANIPVTVRRLKRVFGNLCQGLEAFLSSSRSRCTPCWPLQVKKKNIIWMLPESLCCLLPQVANSKKRLGSRNHTNCGSVCF